VSPNIDKGEIAATVLERVRSDERFETLNSFVLAGDAKNAESEDIRSLEIPSTVSSGSFEAFQT